ncbi:NADH-quinone oxidoreductase subunit A [Streptomyces griseoruber]
MLRRGRRPRQGPGGGRIGLARPWLRLLAREGYRVPTSWTPTPTPAGGGPFPIKYYLTAMLFIIFDIEIVFLYPWAVTFDALGLFGLVEMLLFVLTVFVAYAYVWRRGGLEWD